MPPLFHCPTCGFFSAETNQCMINVPLAGLNDPKNGYCHNHTFNPRVCECCGSAVVPWAKMEYVAADGTDVMICPECSQNYGECATCTHSRKDCHFQYFVASTPGLNIPPIIQETKIQGNMRVMRQVRNPQVMEMACTGCPCYINKQCAMDTGSGCRNYVINSIRK